jgi:hypothetical protein
MISHLEFLLIVYLRGVRVEIGRGRGEVSTHGADERLGIRVGRQVILTPKRTNKCVRNKTLKSPGSTSVSLLKKHGSGRSKESDFDPLFWILIGKFFGLPVADP